MSTRWLKNTTVSMLFLLLGVAGCENTQGTLEPTVQMNAASAKAATAHERVRGTVPAQVTVLTVTKRIGSEGGVLEHAGHRLTVPAGALSETALFRMRLDRSGYVQVDLTAMGTGNRQDVNLGKLGFAKPVILQLSYSYASGVTDPSRLGVVWVKSDGTTEWLPSQVDLEAGTVEAHLDHFSQYALAYP